MIKVKESGLSRYVLVCTFSVLFNVASRSLVRSIGVSNFTLDWLQRVVKSGEVPAVNQVPYHSAQSRVKDNYKPLFADQTSPVQLRVMEGRLGIFGETWYRY